MNRTKSSFAIRLASLVVGFMLLVSYPLAAVTYADDSSTTTPTSNSTSNPGPSAPSGADANTYTYNPTTGLWENAYYTWDPVTKVTTPKTPLTYSYNPKTGMWDTTQWVFDAPSGKYVPNVVSSPANPNPSAGDPSITNAGPNSTNNIGQTTTNTGTFNGFYNATISNNQKSTATSGNAVISGNTTGGSATSGDASNIANILNILQSNWNPQNLPTIFNANINGNITGDLTLDPNIINTTGPGSNSGINTTTNNNMTINSQANGAINNNIDLASTSGNATVSGNTTGGNATSGDARAVANLINILNSAITDGRAFIGNININGNLNGDILLPPGFLEQMIANSGPSSSVSTTQTVNNTLNANLNNNQSITNNTNLNANSGTAAVTDNTTGGSAKTGSADTNLTVLNLTGQQVIGKNTLLVFVNVLGKWVGMLMNAPGNSNSAAYCGGNCTINSLINNNAAVNQTSTDTINNNLNLSSLSGNALVNKNTNGGNATSGNASSSANILNITGSQLNSLDWLGILFINVNGFWNGSFGFNTPAGNTNNPASASPAVAALAKVFKVVPDPSGNGGFKITATGGTTGGGSATPATQTSSTVKNAALSAAVGRNAKKGGIPAWLPISIAVSIVVLIMAGGLISELSDKIWAMRIARAQNKTGLSLSLPRVSAPKVGLPKVSFKFLAIFANSAREWLTSFTWKFPIL